ncbi:hypothetical protein OG2516_19015 [Oceanicola granulosus HTCC2516]|uniref:Uncharacterized protein n=1 Tax=Oceanicola granulosus (strain ATCC BAA-861 / DSM 15982 / KCTC 12143 / HTCC2516) TaxID=314256 RepID=Q2CBR5_OCEGH|nr:hypothetical protein OG2516_19015 [Oceanicola granulosus HTCC2516]
MAGSRAPEAGSKARAVVQALPSAETLSESASVPARPISARPDQPDWNSRLAVSPAAALLIVSRWPAPSWVSSVAGAATARRLVASALVLTPSVPASGAAPAAASQALPDQIISVAVALSQARQPGRGAWNTQPDPLQAATRPSCPAQAPPAPAPTTCASPAAGLAGGALVPTASTASCTSTSSASSASLWVTCFCACAGSR